MRIKLARLKSYLKEEPSLGMVKIIQIIKRADFEKSELLLVKWKRKQSNKRGIIRKLCAHPHKYFVTSQEKLATLLCNCGKADK